MYVFISFGGYSTNVCWLYRVGQTGHWQTSEDSTDFQSGYTSFYAPCNAGVPGAPYLHQLFGIVSLFKQDKTKPHYSPGKDAREPARCLNQ